MHVLPPAIAYYIRKNRPTPFGMGSYKTECNDACTVVEEQNNGIRLPAVTFREAGLGRMLSPDPILQTPGNSQNYNRYTYAMNNPLKYTDPSGYYHEESWERESRSTYNYSGSLNPGNNGASTMTSNPYMPSYASGPYHYSWGARRYEDNNGDFVSGAQAMAWAMQYSSSTKHVSDILYASSKIGGTMFTGLFFTDGTFWHISMGSITGFLGLRDKYGLELAAKNDLGEAGGGYEAGIVSQSEFHSAFTQMANIGINGGYFVSFYSKTFKGSDGNWYAKTSATAYAPHAENMSDKLSYFGTTEVIVGGEVISRGNFRVPSDNNSYFITQGHTWLGNAYNALPAGGNAQLRITISYNAYQFWNGHAYPTNPYQYIINYP